MAFVAVNDLDRALAFYVDTLGSSLVEPPSASHPEACVVTAPGSGDSSGDSLLSLTLVLVPTRRGNGATATGGPPGAAAAAGAPGRQATTEASLQADIELARVDDAVVDDAGLWRTPQGDVVTWFRDQAGAIASLAHRAA